ncbi:MAG: hypothetical protein JWO49_2860, partial [Arthrobacter sp.]|nr:hypothetical protein [Arthrobacter sp.]
FGDVIDFEMNDISVGINDSSVDGFAVDFTKMKHRLPSAPTVDIAGYLVGTGGQAINLDFDTQIIEASVGHARANIGGILTAEGGFAFRRQFLEEVNYNILGFEAKMPGEVLVVVAKDVYAFAGIGGPYKTDVNGDGVYEVENEHAVGLAIDNLDFALAMVTPAVGPNLTIDIDVRFWTLEASADLAGLVGTDPFITLRATNLDFELNGGTIKDIPVPIFVDWGANPLHIPIGTQGDEYVFDQDSAMFRIKLDAELGLFSLFNLKIPTLDFTFVMPEIPGLPDWAHLSLPTLPNLPGIPDFLHIPGLNLGTFDISSFLPRLSLGSLPDFELPDVDFPGLGFLKGALDFVKNLDLSIGLDVNFNLTLFGSIELPDLSLNLGDFVWLNGDFKLSFGQTFTAAMNTGLPTDLVALETLLGSSNQSLLNGIKTAAGVGQNYSRIEDVVFKGFTFGAADVNMFVGSAGDDGPDWTRDLNDQGIVGFGITDLDIALTVFQATGSFADLIEAQKFYSLKAHANSLTTAGFGDVLGLHAHDITIEINSGGKALGGLMTATADFTSVTRAAGDPVGLAVQTGGTPVYLDFTGNQLLGLDIGMAEIQVSEFLYLRGSLAFRKGDTYNVMVNPGGLSPLIDSLNSTQGTAIPNPLPMQVTALTLGGANLSGFAGVGGPYRYGVDADHDGYLDSINDGAMGLVIDHVDFGLAIMTPTLATAIPGMEQYAPKFISVKARVGTAELKGVDPDLLEVHAEDVEVNINTFVVPSLGAVGNAVLQLFGPPSIDYTKGDFAAEDTNANGILDTGEDRDHDGVLDGKGFAVPAGGSNSVLLDFNEEIVQAKVGYASINLAGFVQLTASMAFTKKGSEEVTLSDGTHTTVTTLAVGI